MADEVDDEPGAQRRRHRHLVRGALLGGAGHAEPGGPDDRGGDRDQQGHCVGHRDPPPGPAPDRRTASIPRPCPSCSPEATPASRISAVQAASSRPGRSRSPSTASSTASPTPRVRPHPSAPTATPTPSANGSTGHDLPHEPAPDVQRPADPRHHRHDEVEEPAVVGQAREDRWTGPGNRPSAVSTAADPSACPEPCARERRRRPPRPAVRSDPGATGRSTATAAVRFPVPGVGVGAQPGGERDHRPYRRRPRRGQGLGDQGEHDDRRAGVQRARDGADLGGVPDTGDDPGARRAAGRAVTQGPGAGAPCAGEGDDPGGATAGEGESLAASRPVRDGAAPRADGHRRALVGRAAARGRR